MKHIVNHYVFFALLVVFSVTASAQTDVTDTYLSNPSFEDGLTDWTSSGMSTQTNTSFTLKDEDTYIEKWVSKGSLVGDGYVQQTISSLPNGVYQLSVAAQNIQQGSTSTAQTGAYIFADDAQTTVTTTNTYSLTFTVLEESVTVGFVAEDATGNWIAIDNFQLYFVSDALTDILSELASRIEKAQALTDQTMQSTVLAALNEAISAATEEYQAATGENITAVATSLRSATEDAQKSIAAYTDLQTAITSALAVYVDTLEGASDFLAVIQSAQATAADPDASIDDLEAGVTALETAILAFHIANASGTIPTVVSDTRYARGATMAFGRSTVSGVATSRILEQGFCYSTTNKEPTVLDSRSTEYLENNGYIYVMRDLEPSTIYYIRAYAMTKTYAVGYGDPIKVITIPKGKITYYYNYGGSTAENERINNALAEGTDYWNNLTSINGLHITCSYGSSTATADCSYGGSMRVGPNSSYQATGTILHEMGHAIGVGTHSVWYNSDSPLRAGSGTGQWLGDRATAVVRFWDNDDTSYMTGDGTHMWPYGINGASEDTGTDVLYMGNSLITQGLGEDGLPPTGGFCTPAYVLEQEDETKYYIKIEDSQIGLYSSYLTSNSGGSSIKCEEMTAEEAAANDYAAWYITFDPTTQYYMFQNAGNGYYLSYNSSRERFIATSKTSPSSTERFHVMKGRNDVTVGTGDDVYTTRGYWIIYPEATLNPYCLGSTSAGRSTVATFDLSDAATNQRWVILAADEIDNFENSIISERQSELDDMLDWVKALAQTPHTEDVEGTDATLESAITDIETQAAQSTLSSSQLSSLLDEAQDAALAFLSGATPTDVDEPFEITRLMSDPSIEDASGWSTTPTINYSCAEFYAMTFDFNQTISNLPAGTYQFKGQAFQRPGSTSAVYSDYSDGIDNVNAQIYAASDAEYIQNIIAGASRRSKGGTETTVGSKYVPNDMEAASYYFADDLYDNGVVTELTADGSLKVGLRCTSYSSYYWTCFDNFRLYFYGNLSVEDVETGLIAIDATTSEDDLFANPADIYSISGVCVRRAATSLDGLKRGIYIVRGNKVVVK